MKFLRQNFLQNINICKQKMSESGTLGALPMNFDDSLINLVRVNPLLYAKDKRVKPYESMKEKSDLWKSIATSLGVEPNFCIVRWKQLLERYRRATKLRNQSTNAAILIDNSLMEKMHFLDRHVSYGHKHGHLANTGTLQTNVAPVSKGEEIFGGVNYEYLPEAMEAQSSTNTSDITFKPLNVLPSTTNSVLVRIKALLEGLDAVNRSKAEKRVLSYLCKCQLKALENESIDDIIF